jgi:hypothetical protein
VYLVVIDGVRIETDPELITVIPFEGAPRKIMARRSHAEMCMRYQSEAARIAAAAAARKAQAQLKKPLPGKREPGQ